MPRFDGSLGSVLASHEHVRSESDSNRAATTAARAAAREQWQREREVAKP